jgi:hypothetical protein
MDRCESVILFLCRRRRVKGVWCWDLFVNSYEKAKEVQEIPHGFLLHECRV